MELMLSMVEYIIGHRAEIVQRRMQPTSIEQAFDVVGHVRASLVADLILCMMCSLAYQGTKEALQRSDTMKGKRPRGEMGPAGPVGLDGADAAQEPPGLTGAQGPKDEE
jgi:hypothetical protein